MVVLRIHPPARDRVTVALKRLLPMLTGSQKMDKVYSLTEDGVVVLDKD